MIDGDLPVRTDITCKKKKEDSQSEYTRSLPDLTMDANSWLINSDNSNQTDVIREIIASLQGLDPNFRSGGINNPGQDHFNVNERKIRELKSKYFNYTLPEYTKRAIHGLHQAYGKYKMQIHQLRLQSATNDALLRNAAVLPTPSSSDVLDPQVASIVLEEGRKVYGVDPVTGLPFKRPLQYTYEVRWDHFKHVVCRSPMSGSLDLSRSLTRLLKAGEDFGLNKDQLGELLLLFTEHELPNFFPVILNLKNTDAVFNHLAGTINSCYELDNVKNQLNSVTRAPGDSLAAIAYKVQSLKLELEMLEKPNDSLSKLETKAENFAKRCLGHFMAENAKKEVRHLVSECNRRGESLTLDRLLSFAQQLEADDHYSLKTSKTLPKHEIQALNFNNSMIGAQPAGHGNRFDRPQGGEKRFVGRPLQERRRQEGFRGESPGRPQRWSREDSADRSGGLSRDRARSFERKDGQPRSASHSPYSQAVRRRELSREASRERGRQRSSDRRRGYDPRSRSGSRDRRNRSYSRGRMEDNRYHPYSRPEEDHGGSMGGRSTGRYSRDRDRESSSKRSFSRSPSSNSQVFCRRCSARGSHTTKSCLLYRETADKPCRVCGQGLHLPQFCKRTPKPSSGAPATPTASPSPARPN